MTGSPASCLYSALNPALIACRAAYLFYCIDVRHLTSYSTSIPSPAAPNRQLPPRFTQWNPRFAGISGLDEPIASVAGYL